MFGIVDQPGIGPLMVPASPLREKGAGGVSPTPAPELGQDTDLVLSELLGLSSEKIGGLHDAGIVAGPEGSSAK
jgi:2-methylfumaryl-CoA isomerase